MSESKSAAIRAMKGRQRVPVLTAYDYPTAKILDQAGIPVILVGDSLGMVVLGYPDTTHVTMEEMEHHVRAVARAKPQALLAADLPYHSYETPEAAVASARSTRRMIRAASSISTQVAMICSRSISLTPRRRSYSTSDSCVPCGAGMR